MVLHYVEGLKYREIAEIVGISEDAVRKRIARGNEKFRQVFDRDSESASGPTGGPLQ
jgi:RNA polymerase sigma-70 factor (ECF subfamily)